MMSLGSLPGDASIDNSDWSEIYSIRIDTITGTGSARNILYFGSDAGVKWSDVKINGESLYPGNTSTTCYKLVLGAGGWYQYFYGTGSTDYLQYRDRAPAVGDVISVGSGANIKPYLQSYAIANTTVVSGAPKYTPVDFTITQQNLVLYNNAASITYGSSYTVSLTNGSVTGTSVTFFGSMSIPGIMTVGDTRYYWDGDLQKLHLTIPQYNISVPNLLANISINSEGDWIVTFNATYDWSYAANVTPNTDNFNYLASVAYVHYPDNTANDGSYFVVSVEVKETNAQDVVDALADVSSGIGELNDTMTDIRDYVPPAADNVSGDAGHNAAAADAASALIPEISGEIKDRYDEIKAEQARQFADLISSADVSTFANIFDRLFSNLWVELLIGSELLFGIVLWLVKWALD